MSARRIGIKQQNDLRWQGRRARTKQTTLQQVRNRREVNRKKTLQNARKGLLRELGFYRKETFLDIVSKVTAINTDVLRKQIYFSGTPGSHIKVSLALGNDTVKWSCLLFFQYIDMMHDNGSKSTVLGSWDNFCNTVILSRFYSGDMVKRAQLFVNNEIIRLLSANSCKEYLNCVDDTYVNQPDVYFLHNILRIMISNLYYARKDGAPRMYNKVNERGTVVNVLKFASRYIKRLQIRKKILQTRVKGETLLSLDMTNQGRLKDFTANYHKYIHVVNFGDKGKFFLPERDIERIIKQTVRRDTFFSIYNNTANILTVNNNTNQNTHLNNSESVHVVHYNDNPLKISMGPLNVYVFNQITKSSSNVLFNQIKHMLEPKIVYSNKETNVFVQNEFRTANATNINKPDAAETYSNLLSKHMGDFLNGVNSIHNNVVFASGDSLACVGYLISLALIPGSVSRLLWEDATNDLVWLVSEGSDHDHFRKVTYQRTAEPGTLLTTRPMTTLVSDNTDPILHTKLEKEKEIFQGLNNIVNLPNLNKQSPLYTKSNFNNIQYYNLLKTNQLANKPVRLF